MSQQNKKHQGVFFLLIITVVVLLTLLPTLTNYSFGQDTVTEISTPIEPLLLGAFPRDLFCSDITEVQLGYSWEQITIGETTLQDVETYLLSLNENYSIWFDENSASWNFNLDSDFFADDPPYIPSGVSVCSNENIVTALRLSWSYVLPVDNRLYLTDLMTRYGVPDTITYGTNSPFEVVGFWFSYGISAQISTASNELFEPNPLDPLYGVVNEIIYFPFQEIDGFETRWPYDRVVNQNPYLPEPRGTENPFDFEAIVATITAQPSRTPTPTFAPLPSTATATATP